MIEKKEREAVIEAITYLGWPRGKKWGMTINVLGQLYDVSVSPDDPEKLEIWRYNDGKE